MSKIIEFNGFWCTEEFLEEAKKIANEAHEYAVEQVLKGEGKRVEEPKLALVEKDGKQHIAYLLDDNKGTCFYSNAELTNFKFIRWARMMDI